MRIPLALAAAAALVALTGCSSSSPSDGAALRASSAPTPTGASPSPSQGLDGQLFTKAPTSPPSAGTGGSASTAPGASGGPGVSGGSGGSGGSVPSKAPSAARPLTTQAPGQTAAAEATAPGTYTLDSEGTVTLGSPGTPQDASGTATLTVDPIRNGLQHSVLRSESQGDTEQDVLVRDKGSYAAGIKLTSPAFTKEFRPTPAVLLVPDPATTGASWSWKAVSTDGLTTVTTTNRVVRQETLTIGGTKVACAVVQTRLVLSGDVDYTADLTTWWAPTYRLPVKERTVGKGTFNGFPFSNDITATMRSVKPS